MYPFYSNFSYVLMLCAFGLTLHLDSIGVSQDIVRLVPVPFLSVLFVMGYFVEPEVKLIKWGIICILTVILGVVLGMWFDKQTIYSALMLRYNDFHYHYSPIVVGVGYAGIISIFIYPIVKLVKP